VTFLLTDWFGVVGLWVGSSQATGFVVPEQRLFGLQQLQQNMKVIWPKIREPVYFRQVRRTAQNDLANATEIGVARRLPLCVIVSNLNYGHACSFPAWDAGAIERLLTLANQEWGTDALTEINLPLHGRPGLVE